MIAPWKRDRVGELAAILSSDGVLGVVDIGGVPAKNMLSMRKDLRNSMSITMAKKTLMRLAWEQSGRPMGDLDTLLDGAIQPAIVHTDSMNAFQLFSELEKTRQGRAAKEGEVSPIDIVVEQGPYQRALYDVRMLSGGSSDYGRGATRSLFFPMSGF